MLKCRKNYFPYNLLIVTSATYRHLHLLKNNGRCKSANCLIFLIQFEVQYINTANFHYLGYNRHARYIVKIHFVDPGGSVVIILSSGSEVRGFDPGRGRWIFQSVKILSMTSFGREVKPWVPCRRFTARKRTSNRNKSFWEKIVWLFTLYVGSDADDLRC